jgi:hypothetical protein
VHSSIRNEIADEFALRMHRGTIKIERGGGWEIEQKMEITEKRKKKEGKEKDKRK